VELAVKRDRNMSKLSSLCIQDQFGFLKMRGDVVGGDAGDVLF